MNEFMRIGDICDILNGYAFKSSKYVADGIRVIRITNVQKGFVEDTNPQYYPVSEQREIEKYMLCEGDLLMSLTGNVGRVGLLSAEMLPAALNQRVACIRIRNPAVIYKPFLFHLLNSDYFENKCILASQGVAQKNMSTEWLKEYPIPSFSMDKQMEIASIFDKIDDLIARRKEQVRNMDQAVKSRFIELFGEPLSNQKGWQTMSIVEAAPIKSQRGDLADEVWLLNLDAVEAQTGTVLFKHRVQSGEINASTVYFTAESVLYSKLRPYLNKVVMPDEDGVATSEMIPMYPLADRLNRAYLCYWLRSDAFVRHISEKVTGAKMPRVSMDYFRSLAIEMPPLELQEQFAAFVEQTDKSKYYSSLSFRYCQAAANTYRQEWMTCRTSDF